MATAPTSTSASVSTSPSPSRKRKRQDAEIEELEVDITAPEPPSKKALRKAKKGKQATIKPLTREAVIVEQEDGQLETSRPPKRSAYGIWIGNLPWSASKADLRTFFTANTDITDEMITRLHMPAPKDTANSRSFPKPQNRGFAHVDFSTQAALDEAFTLSESLLTGRRVLIKDSKSFEGRPEKPKEDEDATPSKSGKPASKRIFVGNLDFDMTKEDVREHFSRCGEVLDVHIATFEDSGKCKGYGWVEFDTVEAGQAAVRGWVDFGQKMERSDSEEGKQEEEGSKPRRKARPRKWWVNKFKGRSLRMEFAEAKEVRYKKRFGKNATPRQEVPTGIAEASGVEATSNELSNEQPARTSTSRHDSEPHYTKFSRSTKIDARNIKPGAALAAATRLQGGIVASQGKKTILA